MGRPPLTAIEFLNGQYRWRNLTFLREIRSIAKVGPGGKKYKVRVGEFRCDCGRTYLARLILVKRGTTKHCVMCADRARWAAKRHA